MTRILIAAAALLATAGTAGADPPGNHIGGDGFIVHRHSPLSFVGYGCLFDSTSDGSGVLFNDPTKDYGTVWAWLTVAYDDPTTVSVLDVSITCTVQSSSTYGAGGVSRVSTTSGNTGVLVDNISYNGPQNGHAYLCTTFEWNDTTGHHVVIRDADLDTSNGYQCAELGHANVSDLV